MALTEATCEEVRDRRGRDPRAMPAQYVSSDAIGVKDQDRRTLPDVNAPKAVVLPSPRAAGPHRLRWALA
jgi:hypothetical protein